MPTPSPAAKATETLRGLSRRIGAQEGFAAVAHALSQGQDATLDGVWGSGCALVAAELARAVDRLLVVICPHLDDIDPFCDDISLLSGLTPDRFPAWESEPGERLLQDETYGDRLRVLKELCRLGLRPDLRCEQTRATGKVGSETQPTGMVGSETQPTGMVGSETQATGPRLIVASIHSLLQPTPSRSSLDASSRTLRVGDRLNVEEFLRWLVEHRFHGTSAVELPGEFSSRGGILDVFAPDWFQPVRIELFGDEIESLRRFDARTQRSLEALAEIQITVLDVGPKDHAHFSDYLPPRSAFLLCEPEPIAEQARAYLQRLERPDEFHSFTAVMHQVRRFPTVSASAIAGGSLGVTHHLQIESVERFSGEIDRVRGELDRIGEGHEVFVVSQTEAEIERLGEILRPTKLAAAGRLHFPLGCLRQGFRLAAERVIVITSGELFHRGELRRLPRRRLGRAIDSFIELQEGDLVVHLAHGIGRYRGLELLDKEGRVEEHLKIEFDGGTKIYVPASKIGLVHKYVGGTKTRPALAKIGGKTWIRQKHAAENAVIDLAAEMLEMQAARQARPGIAFTIDSEWQREFDASFPYRETPDQLVAIESITKDMETPRPMDRLLCGDVGFGKTELAMRAAFKAVDNGYQVAVLAPTTVLVEQHYHTFRERMAEFPFDIARLSRFCSAKEQRDIVQGLASGRIDIVIGTHRLASSDIQFCNLGLVIIDEEQRFGVEVKERLKSLRTAVDVLTLSATPIPRTLHMSLVGLRDISNLETPPEDRLAIETRVSRFNRELIRHAVLRELNRGGQIYFVHNRVHDIQVLENALRQTVPEASIRVGHAQMADHELEQVMVAFVNGEFDLLLSTTIVESGLDIPNANTIFIDEADRYGLADLHQLRGRVGRYHHRAYCYLLIDPGKNLTPNAARRLRAIEEFSELGAGFAIAMRDLEIRGAGNLLGTQQSGHIAAVGYELYCQLLENAVRRMRQLPPKLSLDVELNLPGEAYLPNDFVPDIRLKIDLYRRLSRVTSVAQLGELLEEMTDRFGPPPPQVRRMLAREELKIDAALWQIAEIFQEDQFMVFRYTHRPRIEHLARRSGGKLRVIDDSSAYLTLPQRVMPPDELMACVQAALRV